MLQINNLKLKLEYSERDILDRLFDVFGITKEEVIEYSLLKRSIDARDKNNVHYLVSLKVQLANEKKYCGIGGISEYTEPIFSFSIPKRKPKNPIVVVGFGPCGMFCGLLLARLGLCPIIIERGKSVEERQCDIDRFIKTGELNIDSNIQFGEGGAGTFSDGKLTTGVKSEYLSYILKELVFFGAPKEILYENKPHIGSDNLVKIVKNIRDEILRLGGQVLFSHRLKSIVFSGSNVKEAIVSVPANVKNAAVAKGLIKAERSVIAQSNAVETVNANKSISPETVQVIKKGIAETEESETIIKSFPTENMVLCIGHSSRDTYEMLRNSGVKMEQKPFSIGVRIEHLQSEINKAQYGRFADMLPAADYKISEKIDGRGVYTFCNCPGGVVVPSSSEPYCTVTNGMSYFSRSNTNSNSALLVDVRTEDFGGADVLAGVEFQRKYERLAFEEGYKAKCQLVGDFLAGKPSTTCRTIKPSYMRSVVMSDVETALPPFASKCIRAALPLMDKKIKGFANPDAVLTAVESRSSSPVRILRDHNFLTNYSGLYPAGEGCGYAGGIISAALDGIKIAKKIAEQYD